MSTPNFQSSPLSAVDPDAERKARFIEHSRKFINTVVKQSLDTWSPIKVTLHDVRASGKAPAPAWSIPTQIWFDSESLSFDSLSDIASNKGLSVHEMLHILYTPRKGAGITKFAIDNGYTRELNILEDQRIETLATGRWGKSARLWLTPTVLTLILGQDDVSGAFILTHGRKYLPLDVRQAVADKFARPELMPDLARVIDEYRLLVFPKDNDRGEALLEEFYHLLNQFTPPEGGCKGGSSQESGSVRPVPQSEQSKDSERAPSNQPEPQFPSNPAPPEPAPSNPAPSDSDSDGDEESGGSNGQPTDDSSDSTPSTNKSPSPSNPAPQSNDDSDDDQPSDGQGAGTGESIVDTLRDALDKVVNEAREDIINDANAINGMENPLNGVDQNIRKATYDMESVTPETAQASNGFARVLEELQAKHDSGWNRQVSSGKVNLGRWLADKDFDTAFDRFEVGREDAVDIECVVLLDVSGSMSGVRREAFEAMWAVKRALDTVNASTTVITFASDSEVLYGSGDSATSQMRHSHHSGGTEPLVGLSKAQGILADSTRAIKVMLTITDGQWESEDKCDKIASDLRLGGVLTGLVNLNTGYRIDNDHGFEFVADISEVRGIIALGRELVATATARNLAN
jgi:hypothetical protein